MNQATYNLLERHMLGLMRDSAHDRLHVYRVLYLALDIAATETNIDNDILIAACLLHDIGRQRQFENPALDHAMEGGNMTFDFLIRNGWPQEDAEHTRRCIVSHRFRTDRQPESIEAKILFDADKLDVTGALGIARTILYKGQVNEPLYSVDEHMNMLDGTECEPHSFLEEYRHKLSTLYDRFYTKRGSEIAARRQAAAVSFYENLLDELRSTHEIGAEQLARLITAQS